jgi:membrane dipeptidase
MRALAVAFIPLLAACSNTVAHHARADLMPMVIDGHSDFAIHYLRRGWEVQAHDIGTSLPGQSDVPRWRAGGVNGALVTVGTDLPPGSSSHFPRVLESLAWFDALIARNPDALVAAHSADDFERAEKLGKIALMPAIEGGDQIDGSLENLKMAFAAGIRSMGIVYDHHNAIGDGAMAMPGSAGIAARTSNGLTPLGREVIREMNRLGMIVDLSHAAETTAVEAMRLSSAPVIFSHSGARALANTPRNLSDAALHMVAETGGLVMIPLVPYLTTSEHWNWWMAGETRYAELAAQHGDDEAAIERGMLEWDAANPQPLVTVRDVADQVEYIAHLAGMDSVGIGTDFDGMGSFAIPQLADASTLPKLLEELARRGWSQGDLHKLARGNLLRVLSAVEAVAQH